MSDSIQIFISKIPPNSSPNISELHPIQRARAQDLAGKRLQEYIASRLLITGLLEPGWRLNEESRKRLFIFDSKSPAKRNVSLSHSNGVVTIAIAPRNPNIFLGVDVEKIRAGWTAQKADFFCNKDQRKRGLALAHGDQDDFFTKLWTQKEAYFKATQNPFVQKDFSHDPNIYSRKLDEPFFVSVYSQVPLEVELHYVDLETLN